MEITWPPRNRTLGWVDVVGLLGVAGFVVARFIPVARVIPGWGCAFRSLTGWPCPGCGLTRAAEAVARGLWANAFFIHPLGTLAAALIVLCIAISALHLSLGLPVPRVELTNPFLRWAMGIGLVTAVALNYAYLIAWMRFGWVPAWR